MANPYPITVLCNDKKYIWSTQEARMIAIGLDEARYTTLRTSFLACEGIDKSRNIKRLEDREVFAAEVVVWLQEELTEQDKRSIYGRPDLPYEAGFAMYSVVAYFKRKWGEQVRKEQRRIMAAADEADAGEGLEAANDLAAEEPAAEEPAAKEPDAEEPTPEEPDAEEPDAPNEHTDANDLTAEEPAAEEPATEEPDAPNEHTDANDLTTEEPAVEEPAAEEPDAEEPTAEELDAEEPNAPNEHTDANDLTAEEPDAANEYADANDLADEEHNAANQHADANDLEAANQLPVKELNDANQHATINDLTAEELEAAIQHANAIDLDTANQLAVEDLDDLAVEELEASNQHADAIDLDVANQHADANDLKTDNQLPVEELDDANQQATVNDLAAEAANRLADTIDLDTANQLADAINLDTVNQLAVEELDDLAAEEFDATYERVRAWSLRSENSRSSPEHDQVIISPGAIRAISTGGDDEERLSLSPSLGSGYEDLLSPEDEGESILDPEGEAVLDSGDEDILNPEDEDILFPEDEDILFPEDEDEDSDNAASREQSPDDTDSSSEDVEISQPLMESIGSDMDLLVQQGLALVDESLHAEIKNRYAKLRALFLPPEQVQALGAVVLQVVRSSIDAVQTSKHFINYHIRVRRGLEQPVETILKRGKPSFQHIWGPEARNSDIALPFQRLMAASFPVFLIATGYSAGGKTYSLLLPNPQDPPVLEVLLHQALEAQKAQGQAQGQAQEPPLEVTVFTILGKKTITDHLKIGAVDIEGFLQGLQTPGVGKDNGINPLSSRRHVLIEARTATGKHLLSLLDLCGDEDSEIRTGLLKGESDIIAIDLVMLRTLVAQKLQFKLKLTQPLVGARGCDLTRRFAEHLGNFQKVHIVFFCDGGNATSMGLLLGQWKKTRSLSGRRAAEKEEVKEKEVEG